MMENLFSVRVKSRPFSGENRDMAHLHDHKFTYCPECKRKGVYWNTRGLPGEDRHNDHDVCKYCGWTLDYETPGEWSRYWDINSTHFDMSKVTPRDHKWK
jgi:hypothetical protein